MLSVALVATLRAAPTHESLWAFGVAPVNPNRSNLVLATDGYYWGTTQFGGARGFGTIFKVRPDGSDWTTVLSFMSTGTSERGAQPVAGLVAGSDGNLYGTTSSGGAGNFGTIFKVTPAGVLTTLVEFTGASGLNRGSKPNARLVEVGAGIFYGTASVGGPSQYGTIFKVTSAGVLTTLLDFTFAGASNRGRNPQADLVLGSDGLLYGSTQRGGIGDIGTIFKVTTAGVLTTLAEFTGDIGSTKGGNPYGRLEQAADTNFYGTTSTGGTNAAGTIFKVTSAGVLTTLVDFTGNGAINKGSLPQAGLTEASDGTFYGVTSTGGSVGFGTFFNVTPSGSLTTLVEFTSNGTNNRGANPQARLARAADGSLFGTTNGGGATNGGTVFKFASGALTTVADFTDGGATNRGITPQAGLVQGPDGSVYGTTFDGGVNSMGTIYRIDPAGALTTLVQFTGTGGASKGAGPQSGLLLHSDGNFYGTTLQGGASDFGTAFMMTPAGALTTLVEFTGNGATNKGSAPSAGLMPTGDGNFFGATQLGGALNFGTIFKLTPAGALTTLLELTSASASNRGSYPYSTVAAGGDGNFYGTTHSGGANDLGTTFKMSPGGALTTLLEFTGVAGAKRGSFPIAGLTLGLDGNFYGTTASGGANGAGTVFKVTLAGGYTDLVDFTGMGAPNKGSNPQSGLTLGADGNFYGVTYGGGSLNAGTIFKITPLGVMTTLLEFTGLGSQVGAGMNPTYGALIFGVDGNLYGTTAGGGLRGGGTVYRLRFGPTAVTLPASSVTSSTVSFNGTVNPNGLATTAYFEYGTSPLALTSSTATQNPGAGISPVAISAAVTGLAGSTTYYFRQRADNAEQFQPQRGEILPFTTQPGGGPTPTPAFTPTPTPSPTPTTFPTVTPTPTPTPSPTVTPTVTPTPVPTQAPVITSAANTVFTIGVSGSFQATATGAPVPSFSSVGSLPSALIFNAAGLLSGTPALGTAGIYPLTLTATNGVLPNATQSFTLRVNSLPVAGTDHLGTLKGVPVSVTAARLLLNDSDPDGNALSISGVSPASVQGGSVTLTAGVVNYMPPGGFVGADSFTYTLSDGFGGTALGLVNVKVANLAYELLRVVSVNVSAGGVTMVFVGLPGEQYQMQTNDFLTVPWTNLGALIIADPSGNFEYLDTRTPQPPQRFYRPAVVP